MSPKRANTTSATKKAPKGLIQPCRRQAQSMSAISSIKVGD